MSAADEIWASVRAAAKAFRENPAVRAYYREEARKNRIAQEAEEAAAKAVRDAIVEQQRKDAAYDRYALSGYGDPCFIAGQRGHCGSTDCSLFDDEAKCCPYASAADFGYPEPATPNLTPSVAGEA